MSQYQKGKNQEGKTNLDLLEQEIVSGKHLSITTTSVRCSRRLPLLLLEQEIIKQQWQLVRH